MINKALISGVVHSGGEAIAVASQVLRFGTPGPGSYGGPEACDSHLVKKTGMVLSWLELRWFFGVAKISFISFFLDLRLDVRLFFVWGGEIFWVVQGINWLAILRTFFRPKDPKKSWKPLEQFSWVVEVLAIVKLIWFVLKKIQQHQILLLKKNLFGKRWLLVEAIIFPKFSGIWSNQDFYVFTTMWFVEGFIHPLYP